MAQLRKCSLENTTISNILEEGMQELIPTKKIDNFPLQFTKYFSGSRVPNFIIIYATKLHFDWQLLKCLGICIDGILADAFPEMRYEMKKSVHLKKVFFEKGNLLKEWQKGESVPLGNFLAEVDSKAKAIDFQAIFKENLVGQGHLKSADAPFLFDFLNQNNTFENTLKEIEKQMQSPKNKLILNIQKNCVKLTFKNLSFAEQKQILKEIDNDLKEVVTSEPQFAEFQHDIKGLLSGLIKRNDSKKNYNNFTIEDTDNYMDLFLSGTEVEGSCQRVDGDSNLNKCLMAYVFDGKNRLLAVKDKENDRCKKHLPYIMGWQRARPLH
ncbi:MAG: hypothetical protein H0W50_07225 [Parachlamydiaceae bacterium]|nr:hypothetical protein [Parachlamydiaceae bacterium]